MKKIKPLNPNEVFPLGKRLGPAIAAIRMEKGLSPEALAALAGVHPKAVEHWERGRRIISNESLPRVAHVLGTMPSKIYARAERDASNPDA